MRWAAVIAIGLSLLGGSAFAEPPAVGEVRDDGKPPSVVTSEPGQGVQAVDPGLDEIHITFSKPMDRFGITVAPKEGADFPDSSEEPFFIDDRTVAMHVSLLPGRSYALRLNTEEEKGFRDASGRELAPYVLEFKTRPGPARGEQQ